MCAHSGQWVVFLWAVLFSVLRLAQPQRPSFLIEPEDEVIILQGEYSSATITLRCYVINFGSDHTLSWYKDNQSISDNDQLVVDDADVVDFDRYVVSIMDDKLFTLEIREVTAATATADSGLYRCVVKRGGDDVIRTPDAEVRVHVVSMIDSNYPRCIPDAPPYNYSAGVAAVVTCVTVANIPETRLEWFRRQDNTSLPSTRSGTTQDGKLFAEYEWTPSADDDGAVLMCAETHHAYSVFRTCEVGPLTVSAPRKTETAGFTTSEIIGISIGASLAFIALIIILIVVIALKLRHRFDDDDDEYEYEYNNRKYEVTAASDFGWQGTTHKGAQQQTDASGQPLGLGTLSLDTGEVYWKQRSEHAPPTVTNPDVVTDTREPNGLADSREMTPSQTSLTSSRSKSSSQHSSMLNMTTINSDVNTKDVEENEKEHYQSMTSMDEESYTKMDTIPL